MTVRPYGSWTSPITADLLVQDVVRLGDVTVDGDVFYWLEGRPAEGGRQVVVSSAVGDVLPPGWSARSTVHEYGGAPDAAREGTVWFSNFEDQRIYRIDPGQEAVPVPITPKAPRRWAVRYADLQLAPDGDRLAAVRERHLDGGDVVNDLVVIGSDGSVEVIAAGHDFYAAPRWAGSALAWLGWDHPDMPWDGT